MPRPARQSRLILVAAVLLAGCATAAPTRPRAAGALETPRRCSAGDPDRSAWYCVAGRILYSAIASFQPINELTMR
ncbi:MAG: hypothetical protein ACREKQ_11820 [Candidatus Rokuibacteriota bacterium]